MRTSHSILVTLTLIFSNRVFATPLNPALSLYMPLSNFSLNAPSWGVHCFRRLPRELPLKREHCAVCIDIMFADPHLGKARKWSVPESKSAVMEWRHGTCRISVGVWEYASPAVDEDTFSIWDCIGKAQAIISECFHTGNNVGGKSAVRFKERFPSEDRTVQTLRARLLNHARLVTIGRGRGQVK